MINQGSYIGIISKSFRQSKMIFDKIEEIAKSPSAGLFAECIGDIHHKNDMYSMEIGESKIIALPLGDGEKLRGFRFHVMIIDELLLMPEKIINEVIIPFLGVVQDPTKRKKIRETEDLLIKLGRMKEEDRTVFSNNKLIGLSSASYSFEYLKTLYDQYEKSILQPKEGDNAYRMITHFAYDIAPEDLYDQNLINHAKESLSESQFQREFGAVFTEDSSGYFKMSKMLACTIKEGEGQSTEIVGDKEGEYIVAVDPSWSESDTSDDFAMQLIKLNGDGKSGTLVHSYAMFGTNLKKHIHYLLYLLENFNVVGVVMDYNGGVQFFNSVNESEIFKKKGIKLGAIEADLDNPLEYAKGLKEVRNQYNKKTRNFCYLRKPSNSWIREANESLQAAFDHKRILFASDPWDKEFKKQTSCKIDLSNMVFTTEEFVASSGKKQSNGARIIDFLEIQEENIKATKAQCSLIEISTSPQGNQTFDLPLLLKRQSGKNKTRKDSYTALVLGNWWMNVHHDMINLPPDDNAGFEPMFVK
jgi:hypothetical protein